MHSAASYGDLHVAIIMDGNGRWAQARGRPRSVGHAAGARAVRHVVEAARRLGVGTLTLYAFSGDNWKRPSAEVLALMRLFRRYLASETARCVGAGIRLSIVGRRDRLPPALLRAAEAAEAATAACTEMHLRIAVDYSARDAITQAAERLRASAVPITPARFAAELGVASNTGGQVRDVDLLIRTGGEQRLSDFLLWECAYAELWFTARLWPEFTPAELARALADFAIRQRRFGGLASTATAIGA